MLIRKKYSDIVQPCYWAAPPGLPANWDAGRYQAMKAAVRMTTARRLHGRCNLSAKEMHRNSGDARDAQSVERRNSSAPSLFGASVLTGSIRLLSTRGVSTRAATSVREASTEPVCAGARSVRGRATARTISI